MKMQFKLEELDCANCAAFMEEAINKLPEVIDKAEKCIKGVNRKTRIVR